MSSHWFGLVELSFFLGLPIAWAVWELVKLRREQRRDRELEGGREGERERGDR